MVMIKHELDTVQQVKEEIEELREYVDRLEEHTHRRKLRLLEQVGGKFYSALFSVFVSFAFGSLNKELLMIENIFSFRRILFFLSFL